MKKKLFWSLLAFNLFASVSLAENEISDLEKFVISNTVQYYHHALKEATPAFREKTENQVLVFIVGVYLEGDEPVFRSAALRHSLRQLAGKLGDENEFGEKVASFLSKADSLKDMNPIEARETVLFLGFSEKSADKLFTLQDSKNLEPLFQFLFGQD